MRTLNLTIFCLLVVFFFCSCIFSPTENIGNVELLQKAEQHPKLWTSYHSYNGTNSMVQELFSIASNHPSITKLVSIGKSWEGRDIWAIKISDEPWFEDPSEPEVYFNGLHHAREWLAAEVPMYIIHKLVGEYGVNSTITDLVNNRQIWVIPMVNPDGRVYDGVNDGINPSNTNGWRKNRRLNYDGTYGVDLNRNYGYLWGCGGASPETTSDIYMGTAPFSEVEVQAIRNFTKAHRFVTAISYHSFSQLILYPWGCTSESTPDDAVFSALANKLASLITDTAGSGQPYTPMQSYNLYKTTGDDTDWLYHELGVFAFTIELYPARWLPPDPFHPPESKILPVCKDNIEAALYLVKIADNPYQVLRNHFSVEANETFRMHPNETKTVAIKIHNNGQLDDSYNFNLSAPSGWTASLSTTQITLRSMENATITLTVSAPPPQTAVSGVHTILLNVTSAGNSSVKDSVRFKITIPPETDVGVAGLTPFEDWQSYPAGNYTINATVRNYGWKAQSSFNVSCEIKELGAEMNSVIFSDNFDGVDKGWTLQQESIADWEKGSPSVGPSSAHTPPNCWATVLGGNYPNSANDWLISPPIFLPKSASAITLTFWHWYKFEWDSYGYWDFGQLRLSTDGGLNWVMPTYYKGDSWGWVQASINLTQYRGYEVLIAFQLVTDDNTPALGWYIDDVEIVCSIPAEKLVGDVERETQTVLLPEQACILNWNFTFSREGIYKIVVTTLQSADGIPENNRSEVLILIVGNLIVNLTYEFKTAGEYLLSIPYMPVNTSIENVLSSIAGCYEWVMCYDSNDTIDHWKSYSKTKPFYLNDLRTLDNKHGLWLKITSPATLSVSCEIPTITEITLRAGWNLVGYPALLSKNVSEALAGVPWEKVQGYDPAADYSLCDLTVQSMMQPWNGYWIKVTFDCVWAMKP